MNEIWKLLGAGLLGFGIGGIGKIVGGWGGVLFGICIGISFIIMKFEILDKIESLRSKK